MADSLFVVYDRNVRDYAISISGGAPCLELTGGECLKTMGNVEQICRWLLSEGAGRDSLLLAVGGGSVSDTVGFAASVYKRGIRYANFPTTLLSMVDASIGGKTGVNLDGFKNMIGSFRQPEYVHLDMDVLDTLPRGEFVSGSAELLKTFLVSDARKYRRAVGLLSRISARGGTLDAGDKDALAQCCRSAAAIKARIVRRDPCDTGLRHILNLGHTYGHAIEWWQSLHDDGRRLTHGEAVAVGIVKAAMISEELALCRPGLSGTLKKDFLSCSLPVEFPCPEEALAGAVNSDKKRKGDCLEFVALKRIGRAVIRELPLL